MCALELREEGQGSETAKFGVVSVQVVFISMTVAKRR